MWGWLLVLVMRGGSKRPLTTIIALLTATTTLAAIQFGFGQLPALIRFLIATFLALAIHTAWLQSLRQRQ